MIVSVTITDSREAEISGAIRSVIDHVDLALLIDTGATDRTVARAEEVAGEKFAVTEHKWVDFSTARNTGFGIAKGLGAEWIVIVDSDERLNFGAIDLRATLANTTVDVLSFESDDGHYQKEKIFRAGANVRYVGPTHEACVGGSREMLKGATFSELGKTPEQWKHKFTRDVALLTAYTSSNPYDPRWWYYLGASYEGLGDHWRATEAFGECVERRKIGDEAGWAAYKQAECFHVLERFDKAVEAAARGMGACATSAECAWVAAVASFRLGRRDQAVAWARIAEAVGRYKGCGPDRQYFRHLPALYELPYDVLREALPNEEGRKAADAEFHKAKRARLGIATEQDLDEFTISRNVSAPQRTEARTMLRPKKLEELCPSFRASKIEFETKDGWWPTNPNICWHKDELWCVVRTVNYTIEKGGVYNVRDPDNVVRTENYLGKLEGNKLVEPHLMLDRDDAPRKPSRIVGYEDVRLVSIEGADGPELAASATVCDREQDRRLIARLYLYNTGDIRCAEVQPSNQEHEKNWMPLTVNGEFAWIYSLDPTAVLPGPLHPCSFALDHLRGGAVTETDDGFLCVMHESINTDEGRVYLHRFVCLDEEFRVAAVSPAWVFAHHGVEFCLGIVLDDDELVLSYGLEDHEAWIARVNVTDVAEKLEWIAAPEPESESVQTASSQRDPARRLRIAVVNSSYERCGIREYGLQLSRSLAGAVDLTEHTYSDVAMPVLVSSDVVLVHFEHSIASEDLHRKLLNAKLRGAKVVVCCHNYQFAHVAPFMYLVDQFVLHRRYDGAPSNSVEIPLGCPMYAPTETRAQIRDRLGLPNDKLIVTSLGFLAEWKCWGEIIEAVSRETSDVAFLQINTALPFWPNQRVIESETNRIRIALAHGAGRHSTEFLSERDLLDRVHASDLGFVFHPIHTGSVSAATKQFVSARCPLVVTGSSHSSDLERGVVRVESFDPHAFAREVRRIATDEALRSEKADEMKREYERLNMDVIAGLYLNLFNELVAQ